MRAFFANRLAVAGLVILVLFGLVALLAPVIAPYSPTYFNFTPCCPRASHHLLGTTLQGNDIFSQLVYGARASLMVALVTGGPDRRSTAADGYFLRLRRAAWVDAVLSTITNVFLVLPGLALLIIIAAYLPARGLPR